MRHQTISFIKSGIRILGYVALVVAHWKPDHLVYGAVILVVSELIGIAEEIGHE